MHTEHLQLQPLMPPADEFYVQGPSGTPDRTESDRPESAEIQNRESNASHAPHPEDSNLEPSSKSMGIVLEQVDSTALGSQISQDGGPFRLPKYAPQACRVWWLEFLLLLFSGLLLGAICAILAHYNHKPLPDGNNLMGVTLNTLLAILATVLRATIALIAFEVIAQLKWNWISERFRPMQDLRRFDHASRGVYGSIKLLPLAFSHPWTVMAIAVAVASFATGPFIQQTVQTYPCRHMLQHGNHSANVSVVNSDYDWLAGLRLGLYHPRTELQTAIQDAVVNPYTRSNPSQFFNCSTGDCEFPTYGDNEKEPQSERLSYATLGMCSRCVDIYDLVEGPKKVKDSASIRYVFSLPDVVGYEPFYEGITRSPMNISFGPAPEGNYPNGNVEMRVRTINNVTWTRPLSSTDFLDRAKSSIANLTILAASQDHCYTLSNGTVRCPHCQAPSEPFKTCDGPTAAFGATDYIAASCIIYPCIKYYAAQVKRGTVLEKRIRDIPLHQQPEDMVFFQEPWMGVQQPCRVNGTIYTSKNMSKAQLSSDHAAKVQTYTRVEKEQSKHHRIDLTTINAPLECIFAVSENTIPWFSDYFRDTFNARCDAGLYTAASDWICSADTGSWVPKLGPRPYAQHLAGFRRNGSATFEDVLEIVHSMTERITTAFRNEGRGPFLNGPVKVVGQAFETRTCVRVAWAWLALPVLLVLACTILLIRTAINAKHAVNWKASVLPFLLKEQPGLEAMSIKELEELAKNFQVKIDK
ncbi:hypothetical protein FMUND_11245 [Fusarium mundagurra]|uniref:Uncharacterized protein n=1 Tax=Fusarium mundagurra TaxID=1567541 RepID=A0A8H5Y8R4_9HYPO|nr:hypothetical protein FMUND_11245 [Fusarium mundagurra]